VASTPRRHPLDCNPRSDAAYQGRQIEWLLHQEPLGHTRIPSRNSGEAERASSETCELDPFGVMSVPLSFNALHESTKFLYPLNQYDSDQAVLRQCDGMKQSPSKTLHTVARDPDQTALQRGDGMNQSPSKNLQNVAPDPGRDMLLNSSHVVGPILELDNVTASASYPCDSVDLSPVSTSYRNYSVEEESNPDEIRERSSISSNETVSLGLMYCYSMKSC
jgi:hypothetical protein